MMPSRVQTLREANHRIPDWLDCVVARQEQAAVATPDQMAGLLSELLKAGEGLRAEPIPQPGVDPELDHELEKYRWNVERLQRMLPAIHSQLLVERARLEFQRARVQAAAEWARASRRTL
ncbi:MAG: hypothetical protein WAN65_17325 [Candidatus Sulfotelmatobacter sp.]